MSTRNILSTKNTFKRRPKLVHQSLNKYARYPPRAAYSVPVVLSLRVFSNRKSGDLARRYLRQPRVSEEWRSSGKIFLVKKTFRMRHVLVGEKNLFPIIVSRKTNTDESSVFDFTRPKPYFTVHRYHKARVDTIASTRYTMKNTINTCNNHWLNVLQLILI